MKGFIAITTSIILFFLILTIALGLAGSTLITRYSGLDFHLKQRTYFAAQSCLDVALLKLSLDANYAGNETVNISSDIQCAIQAIETSGENKIIKARSQISRATTNLKLTVNSSTLSTVSLEEMVKF